MTAKRGGPRRRRTPEGTGTGRGRAVERRRNLELREVLDELVDHVRRLASGTSALTADELDYAQQRLEWLADEVWRLVLERAERSGS